MNLTSAVQTIPVWVSFDVLIDIFQGATIATSNFSRDASCRLTEWSPWRPSGSDFANDRSAAMSCWKLHMLQMLGRGRQAYSACSSASLRPACLK